MHFPEDHPFSKFNKYYYLESLTTKFHIYIFKFTETYGALINIDFQNKLQADIFKLKFDDDYYFNLAGLYKRITAETQNDILGYASETMEAMINGATK